MRITDMPLKPGSLIGSISFTSDQVRPSSSDQRKPIGVFSCCPFPSRTCLESAACRRRRSVSSRANQGDEAVMILFDAKGDLGTRQVLPLSEER